MDASTAGFSCGCTCMPSASRLHLSNTPAVSCPHTLHAPVERFRSSVRPIVRVRARPIVCSFVRVYLRPLFICLCVIVWRCVCVQHARRVVRRRRGDFARETHSADHARPHPGACARVYYYVGALVRVCVCVRVCVRVFCFHAALRRVREYSRMPFVVVWRRAALLRVREYSEYLVSSLCCCFAFVQRYYAWLDKTAAYTRDTPAGHVSVSPWVLTAVIAGGLTGYSQGYYTHGGALPPAGAARGGGERADGPAARGRALAVHRQRARPARQAVVSPRESPRVPSSTPRTPSLGFKARRSRRACVGPERFRMSAAVGRALQLKRWEVNRFLTAAFSIEYMRRSWQRWAVVALHRARYSYVHVCMIAAMMYALCIEFVVCCGRGVAPLVSPFDL
jgi:hypothetical protein